MQKKLTITIEQKLYERLHRLLGPGRISHFIEDLVRPHVIDKELDAAYKQMAQDEKREFEALEWSEGPVQDVADQMTQRRRE